MISRRGFVVGSGALAVALPWRRSFANSPPRVVVVGGGFGGATAARFVKRFAPNASVTLIERSPAFTACPFSNLVVASLRDMAQQRFGYDGVARDGVDVVIDEVVEVDAEKNRVRTAGGSSFEYDRLILSPGIDPIWDGIDGYDESAAGSMPHAWGAGEQTVNLRNRLRAMPDGGLVVIAAPANPFRCPPGPYERASLIAHYLKTNKPRSKLVILDSKDAFSKKPLFTAAWQRFYGDMISWQGAGDGGSVVAVDAGRGLVLTDFDEYAPAVANIIPPQCAAAIARSAGATDRSGWCPIDPVTFESTLLRGVHVIGDAAMANAMPKSAFAANAQGKVCAAQVVRALAGEPPVTPVLANTCYSLVTPEYGISVVGVYRPGRRFDPVEGAGGTSPIDASDDYRSTEARYASSWFSTITGEVFG